MTHSIKMTDQELKLITSLAADQLFRREFIDPKMPGYRENPAEITLGKALIVRLRLEQDRTSAGRPAVNAAI